MKPTWCTIYSQCISSIPSCIPDSQLYRIISTKCHINTVDPPDDEHEEVRNMYRLQIKLTKYTQKKLCTKLVSFTRLYRDAWSTEHRTEKLYLPQCTSNFDSKNFIKAMDQNSTGYIYFKNKMLKSKRGYLLDLK